MTSPDSTPASGGSGLGGNPPGPSSHDTAREPLKLCTFNANGVFTKVFSGSTGSGSHTRRQVFVSKFFLKHDVSVMGLQEPHLKHWSDLDAFTSFMSSRNISSVCNISPAGNGGAAILFSNRFEIKNSWSLSPRMLFVSLLHEEGFLHNFLIVHFHHDPTLRLAQWRSLRDLSLYMPADTILLADHNSVIIPTRDAAIGHVTVEQPKVLQARAMEVEVLASRALVDAYADVHSGRVSSQELAGWTWGFQADPDRQRNHQAPSTPDPPCTSCNIDGKRPRSTDDSTPVDRRRRIDRIHVPQRLQCGLVQAHTAFVGRSDHKAVLVTLDFSPSRPSVKRRHCPTSFLSDQDTVSRLNEHLSGLPSQGFGWWDKALCIIKQTAIKYEIEHTPPKDMCAASLLSLSTTRVLPGEAWGFLKQHNVFPKSPHAAYSALSFLAEQEATDRTGLIVLDKLKAALDDPYEYQPWRKKQDIWRLVKQLQSKRKLLAIRNKFGIILPDVESMAKEITGSWQDTMSVKGVGVDRCKSYLGSFFGLKDWKSFAAALVKKVDIHLVLAALESLSKTSSPGIDGVSASVYWAFKDVFAPHMLYVFDSAMATGTLPETWTLALLNPIPKVPGIATVLDLRPLVLQNTCLKWFTAIIALQLQDLIAAITPLQQKGCIKGRFIFEHLWDAFGTWHTMEEGLFCFIDFSKAYDSVTHDYCMAFFTLMGLSFEHIRILLFLFKAPIALVLQGAVYKEKIIRPRSGVRQGCPLSPTLFAMLISPIVQRMQAVSDKITVLLYVDDLLIIIHDVPQDAAQAMIQAKAVLDAFSGITGLSINLSKSAILVKGFWPPALTGLLAATGLPIKDKYKYLGVFIGHIPPEVAYGAAIQKALGRAYSMQHWKLSLAERVELLKLWILPLIVYPARVVFPTSPVISMLRTVYSVALRLNSWGVTTSILALPKTLGGLALAQPRTFLLWQHATPFVHSIRSPGSVSKLPYDDFKVFAHRHGIALQQEFLPFFQMGSNVVWNTMPYLAWSARAFSMVKQGASVPDVAGLSYDTPLWNSCLFRNTQQLTYFCPSLIKFGITTVGALLEDESSYELIAPSWRPVYRDTIRRLASPSLVAAGVPECPPLYLWYQWTSVKMVNYLGLAGAEPPRQTEEVWKAFFSSDFPAPHRDTIYQALWKKLPVGERLRSWLPGEVNCPLDGACESVLHAVTACKFLPVAYNTVDKCFPADGPGESVSASTVIHTHPVQSLTSPHGILAWSAFIASWAARCAAKHDASEVVSWSGFLTLWIAVTQLWSAATKLAISGAQLVIFSGALIALRDEGKLSHPTLDASPPTAPTPPSKARATRRLGRKLQLVEIVEDNISRLQGEGFHVIYTDGSAVTHPDVGGIAGYGVYSECGLSISGFLPTDLLQTNNVAELFATIKALGSTTSTKIAICTDSSYVYGGGTGSARRWKVRGWKNANGAAVPHFALWDLLITELDRPLREVQWVKIPSHVGIGGNVEADRLANLGRESSPLYPSDTLAGPAADHLVHSPSKKRKVTHADNPSDFSFLSPDESLLLLGSLGLVPFSDGPSDASSACGSDTASSNGQGHLTSDTVSTASTDSGYASTC